MLLAILIRKDNIKQIKRYKRKGWGPNKYPSKVETIDGNGSKN